jgi:4-hydroxybenzoate polyprenyltransferase
MDGWVESIPGGPARRLARRVRDGAQLMRLHRPIGIYLLLWPVLWTLWMVEGGFPPLKVLLVFVAGVVVMRSAGCVINDFADRDIDPHVKRTLDRPLAARRISPREALVLFAALIALALWLVTRLDWLTVLWSFGGAALTLSYPFAKRFFPLPQFWLGAAFGWAIPMACVALTGQVGQLGWLLFLVTILWAAVYDTFYGMVDRDDDLRLGVKSTAIFFGELDLVAIGALQAMVLLGLWLAGEALDYGWRYQAGLAVGAALFVWQQWIARRRERDACFRAFLNNHWFGLVVFVAILWQIHFSGTQALRG